MHCYKVPTTTYQYQHTRRAYPDLPARLYSHHYQLGGSYGYLARSRSSSMETDTIYQVGRV